MSSQFNVATDVDFVFFQRRRKLPEVARRNIKPLGVRSFYFIDDIGDFLKPSFLF